MKGYAVNDRLRRDQLGELRQLVQVVGRTLQHQDYFNKIPISPTEVFDEALISLIGSNLK